MRFGVTLPNLGLVDGPTRLVELAVLAEAAGWDGVFVWDTFGGPEYDALFEKDPARRAPWDPWVVLAAIGAATQRVRVGTMVTPLTRRRPWKVAAEVATLDRLSRGRVVLSVSLGWVPDAAFAAVDEETDRRRRAERLDEALTIMTGMWQSDTTTFDGAHFSTRSLPGISPIQQPRVPIWVVGAWPRPKSMRRALAYDGLIPCVFADDLGWMQPSPEQLAEIARSTAASVVEGYEIIVEGNSSRDPRKAVATVRPYEDSGATWWLEGVWSFLWTPETADSRIVKRIEAGPPLM